MRFVNYTDTRTPVSKHPESLRDVLQAILMCNLVENHWEPQNPECSCPALGPPLPAGAGLLDMEPKVAVSVGDVAWPLFDALPPSSQASSPTLVSLLQTPADPWSTVVLGFLTSATVPHSSLCPPGPYLCPSEESHGDRSGAT